MLDTEVKIVEKGLQVKEQAKEKKMNLLTKGKQKTE